MTLLSPDVVALLVLDGLLDLFATLAFVVALQILFRWDPDAATPLQYRLQKRAYLVATIVAFIFYLKLPLFFYFVYTLDSLSLVIPGAMCAAGVTTATVYGVPLFAVKILDLYLFGLWLVLHTIDMKHPTMPYTRVKFFVYALLYPLLMLESYLQLRHFANLDPHVIVSCCGTLFSAAKTSSFAYFVQLPWQVTVGAFYGLFLAILLAGYRRYVGLVALLNLLFLPVAILSLIAFFSTYVYEMPHHHCPFCLLQGDYHYVGYLMYAALFAGTFGGLAAWLARRLGDASWRRWYRVSLWGDTLYVALVSYYPIAFYLKNGVWL
ncbi:hypothetical protein [Hydrogenimonas sp.]